MCECEGWGLWFENMEERDGLESLDVEWRIILKGNRTGVLEWIHVAQGRGPCLPAMNTTINILGP
jgi:hypothetical protein